MYMQLKLPVIANYCMHNLQIQNVSERTYAIHVPRHVGVNLGYCHRLCKTHPNSISFHVLPLQLPLRNPSCIKWFYMYLCIFHSHEHIEILSINQEILFFRQRESEYLPSLRLLHKCKCCSVKLMPCQWPPLHCC